MKHLVFGTAGHIDHGKTSLIKALTNVDCDTHKEEKERGITINLGFTYLNLENNTSIGVVDVPGHKDFIHTMVGGACGIDFFLLVIAADSGIMPQTKEHFNILKVLGIKKGIIVITKIDLIDEMILELAKEEIDDFLKGTFLENAPIVEVSSTSGKGINNLRSAITGITKNIDEKPKGNLFRLYIDRIFNIKGFGTVVTGTVMNGEICTSKEIFVLPENRDPLRIRKMERHGEPTDTVYAGDRAAINIVGLKKNDFERGMIVSDAYIEATTFVDAKLTLFEGSTNLNLWSDVIYYSGTFESRARIHLINKNKIREKDNAIVQIHLDKPCILLNGDRFVIRNTSNDQTLGGGSIIDAKPLHHKRRPLKLIESISKLAEGSIIEQIRTEVRKKLIPVGAQNIAKSLNISLDEIVKVCKKNEFDDLLVYQINDEIILIEKVRDNRFTERIIDNIKAYHKRNPMISYGMTSQSLINKFGFKGIEICEIYVNALLEKIGKDNIIKKKKDTWIITDHMPTIDNDTLDEINWLELLLRNYKMQTPLMSEIEYKTHQKGIYKDKLKQYLHYLTKEKKIYKIKDDYIHTSIVDSCRKKILSALVKRNEGLTISQFRDITGGNRKICLLLIGQFDKEEITIRKDDCRFITKKGIELVNSGIS